MVEFSEADHTYTVDGTQYPSVTQVLQAEGFIDTRWYDEWSREKGKYGHRATALYDQGDLDEASLDPVLVPYLDAWKRFREDTGFLPSAVEVPLVNVRLGFAGTPDRVGTMRDGECFILDLKLGHVEPWAALQTGAYRLLIESPYRRAAVQLKGNGKPHITIHNDRQDMQIFQAALSCHNWKKNNLRRS